MSGLDWIKVYAEARVAFPADVWLRTEDDERGGVRITAYRREFEPPLPEDAPEPADTPGGVRLAFHDDTLIAHVERIYTLSYVVRGDGPPAALLARRAAGQWEHAASERRSRT